MMVDKTLKINKQTNNKNILDAYLGLSTVES
jgi:hypothetical protein